MQNSGRGGRRAPDRDRPRSQQATNFFKRRAKPAICRTIHVSATVDGRDPMKAGPGCTWRRLYLHTATVWSPAFTRFLVTREWDRLKAGLQTSALVVEAEVSRYVPGEGESPGSRPSTVAASSKLFQAQGETGNLPNYSRFCDRGRSRSCQRRRKTNRRADLQNTTFLKILSEIC